MLILIDNIHICYASIRHNASKSGITVVIFVANDCDALCACRILASLFKSDSIQYTIIPTFSYTDIEINFNSIKTNTSLKSIVFLNCGGQIDLTDKWFGQKDSKIDCYLFDSHRPIHHNNINQNDNIIVVDDGVSKLKECPLSEDIIDIEAPYEEEKSNEEEKETNNAQKNKEIYLARINKMKTYYGGSFYGKSCILFGIHAGKITQ